MLRNTLFSALCASALLLSSSAFAESGGGGSTCTPDTTVTTSTPYTVCTPVTTTTDLGYNACSIGGDRSINSGDFAMGGNCSEATETNTTQNCTIAYTTTTSVVKGNCPVDECADGGGHHCNHGGGQGG